MKADLHRGLDFYSPAEDRNKVLIIGDGHVGSYVAFGLARMGVKNITIVDHDVVEAHNLPNQFFAESLITEETILKVYASKRTIENIVSDVDIKVYPSKIEACGEVLENKDDYSVIIVCVDDMNVRKWIWNEFQGSARFLIDVRTGGQYFNVFSIDTRRDDARKYYINSLHSNEEAAPLPCTGRAIIDVSFATAAEMIQRYRKFVKGIYNLIHTFHDFDFGGQSMIMQMAPAGYQGASIPKTSDFIHNVGAENGEGNTSI